GAWGDILKKFPLLEELSLYDTHSLLEEDIEAAGRYCPLLTTLRVNHIAVFIIEESITLHNVMAIAIGKTLHTLRHLELIENCMSNIGLKAILDGCCHLETLDLRMCLYIDLNGDMGKESEKQIKNLNILYSNDYDYTSVSNEDSNDLEDMNQILLSMSMFE
nr:putative F-box/LRR-repeat protein 23 [Tanacetum cinerariifolium]